MYLSADPQPRRHRRTISMFTAMVAALWLASAGLATPVHALPDDRLQSIEITAATAIRDEKAGYTIYSGDVVLEQGSLHIEADRLTIFHDREAADRIVALGAPATLRQQPEADQGLVTASANRIVYEKSRERVMLREAASIEQDGAVVTGESIDYFMAEQRVAASGRQNDENARVQVVIPAEVIAEHSEEDAPAANTPDAAGDGSASTATETTPERDAGSSSGAPTAEPDAAATATEPVVDSSAPPPTPADNRSAPSDTGTNADPRST